MEEGLRGSLGMLPAQQAPAEGIQRLRSACLGALPLGRPPGVLPRLPPMLLPTENLPDLPFKTPVTPQPFLSPLLLVFVHGTEHSPTPSSRCPFLPTERTPFRS